MVTFVKVIWYVYLMQLFLLFLIFINTATTQDTLTGKAVRIADGDTFTLLDNNNTQTRIRLHGIDCAEKNQDFGNVATKFLGDKLKGKTVKVKVTDIDRYGRTIRIVYVDGKDINLALLKAGLAWHHKHFDKSKEYADAEIESKNNKLGLWKQPNAIAPWDWRRRK